MSSLGLLAQDSGGRLALTGRPRPGRRRVAILGAGVSGMSAAYELGKLGFDCTVLEARGRPGGRNWTVRRGTVEAELGRPPQTCRFDPGLFMNAGPMRISHTHSTSLAYCRELGVPLIPFPMVNEACYVYAPGFKRMRLREVHADWIGYTAELLAKAVNQDKLDLALSSADRRQLIETLRQAGFLNSSLTYPDNDPPAGLQLGSDDSPRGFVTLPGTVGEPVQPTRPVPFDTLIRSGYVGQTGLIPGELDWQPTMLTPEGGMDRLAYAFANKLGGVIRYRAVVTAARRTSAAGVRLTYTDLADTTGGAGGTPKELTADFCLC
ncbi:MAG TPA: FAD-dependent oxidoreductase, partial [Opitutaceae bacterium]|nr:FAD-dependent oxidoreductase [Opitutaceae bacterium]